MKGSCKDCQDRHQNCHASCERYAEFKAENERIRNEAWKAKEFEYFLRSEKASLRKTWTTSKVFTSKKK